MNVIMGAFGQVGSEVCRLLEENGHSVRRVTSTQKNIDEANQIDLMERKIVYGNYFEHSSLEYAFNGGKTALIIPPENPDSVNVMNDAKEVYDNYKYALAASSIERIVILSSAGAQDTKETGMFQVYEMMEHLGYDLSIQSFVIRPSYYYSNFMMGNMMDLLNNRPDSSSAIGIPCVFPNSMEIPMIAPKDVAKVLYEHLVGSDLIQNNPVEITGPSYSPTDIAKAIGQKVNVAVLPHYINAFEYEQMLVHAGFSKSSAMFMTDMAQTVISGNSKFVTEPIMMDTTIEMYLDDVLGKSNG